MAAAMYRHGDVHLIRVDTLPDGVRRRRRSHRRAVLNLAPARGDGGGVAAIGTAGTGGITAATPLRIFLSHTSDLGKPGEVGSFVAAAVAAVLRAGHAVTNMAYFAARDMWPADLCTAMVAQSDVYVGIIGVRYGSPVRDRPDVSYTELEFEAATTRGQPRLIVLIREDSAHLKPAGQPVEHQARQVGFRARLLGVGLTAAEVESPAQLELAVYQALVELGLSPGVPSTTGARRSSKPIAQIPLRASVKPAPDRDRGGANSRRRRR